jgi:hypothetical protein
MPEIRISDPALLEVLAKDLSERPDIVVDRIADDRLLVSILGSYGTKGMRLATYLRLRAWEAAQRAQGNDVSVEIVEE